MKVWKQAARVTGAVAISAAGLVAMAGPAFAVPSNDTRANAEAIGEGVVVNGDTAGATLETGEQSNSCSAGFGGTGDNTVWYSITAAGVGNLTASMTSETDEAVSVYDASGTQEIACDDDEVGGATEEATWSATSGTTYLISVARYTAGEEGPFTLVVNSSAEPPPPTDGAFSVAPPTVDFGQVQVGTQSAPMAVVLSNSNSDSAISFSAALSNESPAGQWNVVSGPNDCPFDEGQGAAFVPAGSSCEYDFVFVPTEAGPWTLSIDWSSADGSGHTDLTGEGTDDGGPPPDVPEAPMALLLPGSTLLLGAGVYLVRRRMNRMAPLA